MADPGNTKNVPRKGPTEPLMPRREPSLEPDGNSELRFSPQFVKTDGLRWRIMADPGHYKNLDAYPWREPYRANFEDELRQYHRSVSNQPISKDEPQQRFGSKRLDTYPCRRTFQANLEDELRRSERSERSPRYKPITEEKRQPLIRSLSNQPISEDELQQRFVAKRLDTYPWRQPYQANFEDELRQLNRTERVSRYKPSTEEKLQPLTRSLSNQPISEDKTQQRFGSKRLDTYPCRQTFQANLEDELRRSERSERSPRYKPITEEKRQPLIRSLSNQAISEDEPQQRFVAKREEMSGSDGRLETSSLGVDVQGLTAEERMSDTYFESFRVEGLGTSLTLDREPPPEQGSESSVVTELPDAIEKNLNDTLDKGDFDAIKKEVTPKTLSSCKTNTLFQAFQVNKKLRRLADRKGPEKDDIEKLAKSVDEFTLALVDPLKSNADTRHKFQSFFDSVVDEAIDTRQKKFISHPVVYDLLNYRWYRSFYSERKKSWQEPRRWGYLFLNLWTVFDIIFFPFLFAVFFVVHFLKKVSRKRRGAKICFVLTLREGTPSKEFDLIKSTMSHVVGKYGFHPTNYCVILHDKERLIGNIKFGQECSKSMLTELPKPNSPSSLCEDLKAACRAFESQNISNKAKQVLVLFLNDLKHRVKNEGDDSEKYRKELEKKQVNIVPIGIGQYAKLSELKRMQTKDGTASHFGEHELPETLGTAIIQGIEGKDIYENYMDYFTTPYFVFFRDTVSYLTLLGLHFAICLSPSTVSFSGLEWFVLIFFMGRILMEADQFISSKMERKRSDEPKQTKNEAGYIFPKKLISYFSDRWNVLDFIILTFYLITFILRIIVWRNFTDVSDNRLLAVSEYCYGFIAMLLTLRAFGQVMECIQGLGAIQIALFFIIWDVMPILWQFLAAILAFSLAMTKIYVAEKAYTLGKESAENLACSKSGMICWWNIATHLCWSLLGLADLDKLNSVDNPSVSLIHLLYIFFLIIAVILLVNMMIALLSNTYQQVQDNSLQEWSFKKAVTVRTYSTYHPIPVPFNLLSVPLIVLWNLGRKRSCKTWFVSSALDEEGKREGLDKVVKELESVYFQKFGYEFPLTEEKKIDQLVQENEGGRKITNQIVRQIFQPRGNNEKKLASGQRAWYYSPGIAIDGCLLTYLGPDFCYRCRNRGIRKKIHSAQFKYPFTIEMPRFEVLIQETGERRIIALGAVRESDGAVNNHYSCHAMPGWDDGTVGYHVYYGTIFENGCREKGREVKGAMAYRGDTIACEVDFKEQHEGKISVLFYLNDREVARCSMEYTSGQKLNPFVTLGFEGITVLTKMCHRDEDGDPSSRVTDVDLQAEFAVLKWLSEHTYGMQPALRREMEQLQIAREGLEIQLHEQMVMFSELKYLVQSLKELKEKPEEPGNVV